MERLMKRVAVLPWTGIPGAYLIVSGKRRRQELFGEYWYAGHEEHRNRHSDHEVRCESYITFCFDAGDVCAEWDGECGPIQRWYRCEEGWKSENGYDEARPHWLYPFAYGSGHWSQLAVNEEELPARFAEGDYEGIFRVLERWAKP